MATDRRATTTKSSSNNPNDHPRCPPLSTTTSTSHYRQDSKTPRGSQLEPISWAFVLHACWPTPHRRWRSTPTNPGEEEEHLRLLYRRNKLPTDPSIIRRLASSSPSPQSPLWIAAASARATVIYPSPSIDDGPPQLLHEETWRLNMPPSSRSSSD